MVATRFVRFTIARARARGLAFRLEDRRFAADFRPLLRLAELRFAELRLADPRFAVLRLAELRLVELRLAVLRLAELRFAVRFDLPRAADLLRDDFFAAIDVCSCRGGWFKVPDSKIRAHNLRGVTGGVGITARVTVSNEDKNA